MTTKGSAAAQGELWSVRPEEWAYLQEPKHTAAWLEALSRTNVGRGSRVLDVGCGAGGALVHANRLGARVAGVDASQGLLDIARARLPSADLRVCDLETLPWEDASFDVVLACNAFQYAADPLNAMREAARVTRPDGRLAIVQWAEPARCEMAPVFSALRAIQPPRAGPAPLDLSDERKLTEHLDRAGMRVESVSLVDGTMEYPTVEDAMRASIFSAGPGQAALRAAGLEKTTAAIRGVFEAHAKTGLGVRLRNEFRLVIASVPPSA